MSEEVKADGFVRPGYSCADDCTAEWVHQQTRSLVGRKAETPKSGPKYFACVADVVRTIQKTPSGLIAWPMNDAHYSGAAYGRDIAQKTKAALIRQEHLVEVQRHSFKFCTVYRAEFDELPDWLKFSKSRPVNLVKVRGPSRWEYGKRKKGKQIPVKRFPKNVVAPLVQDMKTINNMMERYPLIGSDRTVWDSCYRQFNSGDETGQEWTNLGGRIYGDWQNKPSEERLRFLIAGEPVCQIDLKACYLSMANLLSGTPQALPADPYQAIGFVSDQKSRELAKRLVNCLFSKEGPVMRFPRGCDGVSFRDEFSIPKTLKVQDYLNDIFSAFPFLKEFYLDGLELMYHESELMVRSLLTLSETDVPAYPVHDCLICRRDNENVVVEILTKVMKEMFGGVVGLEIEVYGEEPRLVVLESEEDILEPPIA